MDGDQQRAVLRAAVAREGETLASLSRDLLGRNPAYLQQYLERGSPRLLAERDREKLARYLGIDEAALGGRAAADPGVAVPRYLVAAAAGAGAEVAHEARAAPLRFDRAFLARLGVRGDAASLIEVTGDSMQPGLLAGDMILIDHQRRAVAPRGGVYALRIGGALLVKRLRLLGSEIEVASDNPAYPPPAAHPAGAIDVIGRVVWVGRSLAGL